MLSLGHFNPSCSQVPQGSLWAIAACFVEHLCQFLKVGCWGSSTSCHILHHHPATVTISIVLSQAFPFISEEFSVLPSLRQPWHHPNFSAEVLSLLAYFKVAAFVMDVVVGTDSYHHMAAIDLEWTASPSLETGSVASSSRRLQVVAFVA